MNRKDKKELMQNINAFLDTLDYYVDELEKKELVYIIVKNEIERYFKKF